MKDLAESPLDFEPNASGAVRCMLCEEWDTYGRSGPNQLLHMRCDIGPGLYIHEISCLNGPLRDSIDAVYMKRTEQLLNLKAGRPVH